MRTVLACAAVVLAAAPGAFAWGAAGHEIVATIAQMHLHPDVLPVLCDILDPSSSSLSNASEPATHPPCHLAPIAAWADRVRMTPAYRHTATWHYVGAVDDSPGASCAFPGAHGWNGRRDSNVLAALGNQTRVVAGFLDGEGGLRMTLSHCWDFWLLTLSLVDLAENADPVHQDSQAPRPRLGRTRSCRKAPQAPRRSWSRWWSAPPPVRLLHLTSASPRLTRRIVKNQLR